MRILIDIDQVVIDLLPVWLARYNQDFNDFLKPGDITDWAMEKFVKPACGEKIYEYLESSDLYDEALPIPGAYEAICELKKHHSIYFVTARHHDGKFSWLKRHGFIEEGHQNDHQYIACYDKYLISGDVIIDDNVDTVGLFFGTGILFNQPHNAAAEVAIRAQGWSEIVTLLEEKRICPICGEESFFPGREICTACAICMFTLNFSPQSAMHLIDYMFDTGQACHAPIHITEVKRPHQTMAFLRVLSNMYHVHLEKNADYSPANILATGHIGLVTRMWDKMARLLNLAGFRIEISDSSFEEPTDPKNESVDDTLMDMAVYSIIGFLLRQGSWGK